MYKKVWSHEHLLSIELMRFFFPFFIIVTGYNFIKHWAIEKWENEVEGHKALHTFPLVQNVPHKIMNKKMMRSLKMTLSGRVIALLLPDY